jgi:hypothetical protein
MTGVLPTRIEKRNDFFVLPLIKKKQLKIEKF